MEAKLIKDSIKKIAKIIVYNARLLTKKADFDFEEDETSELYGTFEELGVPWEDILDVREEERRPEEEQFPGLEGLEEEQRPKEKRRPEEEQEPPETAPISETHTRIEEEVLNKLNRIYNVDDSINEVVDKIATESKTTTKNPIPLIQEGISTISAEIAALYGNLVYLLSLISAMSLFREKERAQKGIRTLTTPATDFILSALTYLARDFRVALERTLTPELFAEALAGDSSKLIQAIESMPSRLSVYKFLEIHKYPTDFIRSVDQHVVKESIEAIKQMLSTLRSDVAKDASRQIASTIIEDVLLPRLTRKNVLDQIEPPSGVPVDIKFVTNTIYNAVVDTLMPEFETAIFDAITKETSATDKLSFAISRNAQTILQNIKQVLLDHGYQTDRSFDDVFTDSLEGTAVSLSSLDIVKELGESLREEFINESINLLSSRLSKAALAAKQAVQQSPRAFAHYNSVLSNLKEMGLVWSPKQTETENLGHFKTYVDNLYERIVAEPEPLLKEYDEIVDSIYSHLESTYIAKPQLDAASKERAKKLIKEKLDEKVKKGIRDPIINKSTLIEIEAFLHYLYYGLLEKYSDIKTRLLPQELAERLKGIVSRFVKKTSMKGSIIKVGEDLYVVVHQDPEFLYLCDYNQLVYEGTADIIKCASNFDYSIAGALDFDITRCPVDGSIVKKASFCSPCVYGLSTSKCHICLYESLVAQASSQSKLPKVVMSSSAVYDEILSSVRFKQLKKPIKTEKGMVTIYDTVMHRTGKLGVVTDVSTDGALKVLWADTNKETIVWPQEVEKVDESSLLK